MRNQIKSVHFKGCCLMGDSVGHRPIGLLRTSASSWANSQSRWPWGSCETLMNPTDHWMHRGRVGCWAMCPEVNPASFPWKTVDHDPLHSTLAHDLLHWPVLSVLQEKSSMMRDLHVSCSGIECHLCGHSRSTLFRITIAMEISLKVRRTCASSG